VIIDLPAHSIWRGITRSGLRALLALGLAAAAAGCATTTTAEQERNPDPLESVNRKIYAFNDVADRYVVRPVAKGYNTVLPQPLRVGVGNFFDNWTYPVTIVNGLLQGKFRQGAQDATRFLLNSTVGIAGFSDPATALGFRKHQEDFGLTLARWGVPQGPFLMVPLLGPYTARSATGIFVNVQFNPILQMQNSSWRSKLGVGWIVQTRAAFVGPDEILRDTYDPYALWRDFYLQNRAYLQRAGQKNPDDELLDDDDFFEDDVLPDEDFPDDPAPATPEANGVDTTSAASPAYPPQQ
jgi:phospholipid-binding lipoprotein MlaA